MMRACLQQQSSRYMRASILSLHNLLFRLGYVATGPMVGWLSDHRGLSAGFLALAISFALLLPPAALAFLRQQAAVQAQPGAVAQ